MKTTQHPNKKTYHQLICKESFSNLNYYNKFLNWVSGEYDLYLQEQNDDLKIFIPNGNISIKKINTNADTILAEVSIETYNLNSGTSNIDKIHSIYKRLNIVNKKKATLKKE